MSADIRSRYARAYGPVAFGGFCLMASLFFVGCYAQILSTSGNSLVLPAVGAMVYRLGGLVGLIAVSAVLAIVFFVSTVYGLKSITALRRELGAEAIDAVRLERAREFVRKKSPSGRLPAHLQSLDAFRAYSRRVRFMLSFFVLFFALVVLGVYFRVI